MVWLICVTVHGASRGVGLSPSDGSAAGQREGREIHNGRRPGNGKGWERVVPRRGSEGVIPGHVQTNTDRRQIKGSDLNRPHIQVIFSRRSVITFDSFLSSKNIIIDWPILCRSVINIQPSPKEFITDTSKVAGQ